MSKARITLFSALFGACMTCSAQVLIDRPLHLNGNAPSDRSIGPISDAVNPSDALNARSEAAGQYRYGMAIGTNMLNVDLVPTPMALVAGTTIHLAFTATNTNAVQLSVNGGTPAEIVKDGLRPLVTGDLIASSSGIVVFDGVRFHLVSSQRAARRDCPIGFIEINDQYCIELMENDTAHFPEASITCGDRNGRLCTWGEWYNACQQDSILGLQNMTGNWEWTSNTANSDGAVRVVGVGTCSQAGTSGAIGSVPRNFHCCFTR